MGNGMGGENEDNLRTTRDPEKEEVYDDPKTIVEERERAAKREITTIQESTRQRVG